MLKISRYEERDDGVIMELQALSPYTNSIINQVNKFSSSSVAKAYYLRYAGQYLFSLVESFVHHKDKQRLIYMEEQRNDTHKFEAAVSSLQCILHNLRCSAYLDPFEIAAIVGRSISEFSCAIESDSADSNKQKCLQQFQAMKSICQTINSQATTT